MTSPFDSRLNMTALKMKYAVDGCEYRSLDPPENYI